MYHFHINRRKLEFEMIYQHNGEVLTGHDPFRLSVEPLDKDNNIKVAVSGEFYDDPVPDSPPGKLSFRLVAATALGWVTQLYTLTAFSDHLCQFMVTAV